jgi:DNA-binding IclR family transcriptional regulator
MSTFSYEEAFERIRAEFLETPGTRLNLSQVARRCGLHRSVCKDVLEDLVCAGFLSNSPPGTYGRLTDAWTSRDPEQDRSRNDARQLHAVLHPVVTSSKATRA